MESRALKIVLNVLRIGLVALGALISVLIISESSVIGSESETVGYALQLAYFSIILCGGAAILFTVYHFLANFKRSIGSLIGLIIFGVILGISYSSASNKVLPGWEDLAYATPQVSQLVGGGMVAIYLFLALAVLTVIFSEVHRLIR